MKSILQKTFLLLSFFCLLQAAIAQAPSKMSYQAVIRDAGNVLISNANVGIRISILQTQTTGNVVYSETHTPKANTNGLVTLEIGGGTIISGNFATIDWANGPFFIKTETDPTGGTNYTISGTSQLLSVPFALYAASSGNSGNNWSTKGNSGTNSASNFIGTTDDNDIIFGRNKIRAGRIGADNVSFGKDALNPATTGLNNVAIGKSSLSSNTTANENTAIGASSLSVNTTGTANTVVGYNTLNTNATGSNNIAIGVNSGNVESKDRALNTANSSIFIGNSIKALSNNATNEIVIGHNAIGGGSNSITLGNQTNELTRLRGTTLVNTDVDNGKGKLQVNGNITASPATLPEQVVTLGQMQSVANELTTALGPKGQKMPWGPNDVAIYLSAGQSNSYGHGTYMDKVEDQIQTPLTNVFTLKTALHKNLTFNSVTWEGLTSLGDCNLGGGNWNHQYNSTVEFSKQWQAHIAAGNAEGLPNLYVILMGTPSQGMFPNTNVDAWSFTRNTSDVNSLFPRYMKTLRLAIENLRNSGKNPRIIVQNWNQWEAEADGQTNNGTTTFAANYAEMNFRKLIASIKDAVGCEDLPFDFYYPLATIYDAANVAKVRNALTTIINEDPLRLRFNDVRKSPDYTGTSPSFGIFNGDNVHYTGPVQKWFGKQQFDRVIAGYRGVQAGLWPHNSKSTAQIASDVSVALASISSIPTPTKWYAKDYVAGTNIETAPGLSFDVNSTDYSFDVLKVNNIKQIQAKKTGRGYGLMRPVSYVADSMDGEMVVDVQSGDYPAWLGAAFRTSTQGVVGGGFYGVPYSYISCNFDTGLNNGPITTFNVWVLWNSNFNEGRDRRVKVNANQFARPLPTGAFKLRIRLIGTTVYAQYSTDGGTNWLDIITSDNTVTGTPGKTFTFDAAHSSLTNIQTNGGGAGFILGVGSDGSTATGALNGMEFNSLR